MNYEFHVGDYIENREGDVGWVTSVTDENIVWATNDGKTYVMEVSTLNRVQCPEALFVRIGAYDFTKKEKKEIGELEDIENIDMKDWLPVFVVHCIRDCVERMATGAPRWFTAYSSDYITHTFDEYEAAMYLQDLIDEKFGNRRNHR